MEQSFLAYLRGRCRSLPQVAVGMGDDAAVIDPVDGQQIVCTDQIVDGVDFRLDELTSGDGVGSLADIGFKAMAINLSDVAAMGATPTSALVTLSLPRSNATRLAGAVYEGILEAAAEYNVAIAGGDICTYDGPLAVNVVLIGEVARDAAWLRSGAVDGDAIVVTGGFGGSIRGRHLRPSPRVEIAKRLRESLTVHAAIDVSDGLSLDLDRLCAASRVGAELDLDSIPIHQDAHALAESSGRTAFQHAWSDGEDFELIMTMSQEDADRLPQLGLHTSLTQIGHIVGRTGLWKRTNGKVHRLSPQGYVHQGDK